MRKHKPLSSIQLQNLKDTIRELEVPAKLEELAIEVKEFFERHPTPATREIVPRTTERFLTKFLFIMGHY